jgi:voltage-gated sodium channel
LFTAFTTHDLDFGFLLVLRLCRVFKFFRFIRFIPGIEHLFKGINNAIRSSVLVLMSFFILILVLSMLACFLFKHISPENFGNPLLSLYSIFKIFTVEGWYEIPDSIAAKSSWGVALLTRLFFSVLLIVGGVLGLSLVNSIFVDSMVSDSNNNMDQKIDELHKKIDLLTKEIQILRESSGVEEPS